MTDEELVIEARSGCAQAFERLFERYWIRIRHVAWLYLRNHEDAEDEAQTAFLKAWQYLGRCEPAQFRQWLDRIVQNQCLMEHRRRKRHPVSHRLKGILAAGRSPEKQAGDEEMRRLVRMEILKLPQVWRGVLWLRRIEEMEIAEVAGRLSLGTRAAKSRLVWATRALRDRIQRRLG